MAKIKSGAYYMIGEAVFRVIGLDRTGTARYKGVHLYDIEYLGSLPLPIPSKMFADKIKTCTRITKEVADIMVRS